MTTLETQKSPETVRRSIVIRTQFIGFHQWLEAPQEVAFLRNLHRHVFKVECTFDVSHPDRQLEFFITKGTVDHVVDMTAIKLEHTKTMSCEMMAEDIYTRLEKMGLKITRVIVSEDGENDGIFEKLYQ